MVSANSLRNDVNSIIRDQGELVRFRYFNISGADAGYDSNVVLTVSGSDLWTSGAVQPLDTRRGSDEAVLVQQGTLLDNDCKLYVGGSISTSGTFRVGIGSPPREEYSLATEGGVTAWRVAGTIVYKKLWLRRLTTGSLEGE